MGVAVGGIDGVGLGYPFGRIVAAYQAFVEPVDLSLPVITHVHIVMSGWRGSGLNAASDQTSDVGPTRPRQDLGFEPTADRRPPTADR